MVKIQPKWEFSNAKDEVRFQPQHRGLSRGGGLGAVSKQSVGRAGCGGRGKLPCSHAPVPPRQGEEDAQRRQEFKQLILYLKNNKQPDFTH